MFHFFLPNRRGDEWWPNDDGHQTNESVETLRYFTRKKNELFSAITLGQHCMIFLSNKTFIFHIQMQPNWLKQDCTRPQRGSISMLWFISQTKNYIWDNQSRFRFKSIILWRWKMQFYCSMFLSFIFVNKNSANNTTSVQRMKSRMWRVARITCHYKCLHFRNHYYQ